MGPPGDLSGSSVAWSGFICQYLKLFDVKDIHVNFCIETHKNALFQQCIKRNAEKGSEERTDPVLQQCSKEEKKDSDGKSAFTTQCWPSLKPVTAAGPNALAVFCAAPV
jgi:hypothetical protein